MRLDQYLQEVSRLPPPTAAQVDRFAAHLVSVHSWFKHLPLRGADFVVYLQADLGGGFPSEHPRLPLGNTGAGYKEAFGHLAYTWRVEEWSTDFFEDGGPPDEFIESYKFTLYPYCHDGFEESASHHGLVPEVSLSWHPQWSRLSELARILTESDRHWGHVMTAADREWAVHDDDAAEQPTLSDVRRSWLELDHKRIEITRQLQELEMSKVHRALTDLLALTSTAG